MFTITISTRTALVLLVLAVLVIPATAYATHLFADVSDGHPHAPGIKFVHDSGVSLGCGDGTNFCPNDPVTRAQMATFMYRLSGNDPATDPSVDAKTVGGRRIFHASVTGAGVLEAGNASSVTKLFTGTYNVEFSESMAGCTAVGGTGSFGAGSWRSDGIISVSTNFIPDNVIQVSIWDVSLADEGDSDFHVIAVCPDL